MTQNTEQGWPNRLCHRRRRRDTPPKKPLEPPGIRLADAEGPAATTGIAGSPRSRDGRISR